jgi:hypothetical protein
MSAAVGNLSTACWPQRYAATTCARSWSMVPERPCCGSSATERQSEPGLRIVQCAERLEVMGIEPLPPPQSAVRLNCELDCGAASHQCKGPIADRASSNIASRFEVSRCETVWQFETPTHLDYLTLTVLHADNG